ncbi:MAG: zinc ribbon domain-containing protein [Eubacterium sp.]|nr:zinc ribbon domain-containing protein [Eubacterium sp.]
MFCPKCGSPVREEARFCEKCGAGLRAGVTPPPNPMNSTTEREKSSVPKALKIGLPVGLSVVAVALIVVLIFVINGSSGGSRETVPVAEQPAGGSENTGGTGQNPSGGENAATSEAPTSTPEVTPEPTPEPTEEPTPEPKPLLVNGREVTATSGGKVNLYVLKKIKDKDTNEQYQADVELEYYDNGLLKTRNHSGMEGGAWWDFCHYYYDSEKRIKEVKTDARYIHGSDATIKYNGDEIMNVSSKRYDVSEDANIKLKTTFTYDSEGHIIREDKTDKFYDEYYREFTYNENGVISSIRTYSYYYDNEDGDEYEEDNTIDINYDDYGNVTKYGDEKYKNKYKDGVLTDRQKDKYIYEEITVDKKLVDQIQAQQWALLNHDLNKALIIDSGSYNTFYL